MKKIILICLLLGSQSFAGRTLKCDDGKNSLSIDPWNQNQDDSVISMELFTEKGLGHVMFGTSTCEIPSSLEIKCPSLWYHSMSLTLESTRSDSGKQVTFRVSGVMDAKPYEKSATFPVESCKGSK